MGKSQIFKLIAFLILIIFIDQVLGYVIHKASSDYKYDKRIESVLSKQVSPDIMVLGSSRALNNYDTRYISDKTGKIAYNLGVSGTNILFHADLLSLVIESGNIPQTVLYNLDDSSSLFLTEGVIYREEEFYNSIEHPYVRDLVCEKREKSILASRLSRSFRQNVNFSAALNYLFFGKEHSDYLMTNVDEFGANLLSGTEYSNIVKSDSVILKPERISKANLLALNRITQICKANDIELFFVQPPTRNVTGTNFKQLVENGLSDKSVQITDLSNEVFKDDYFYNRSHLNKKGATYFTAMLLSQLNL